MKPNKKDAFSMKKLLHGNQNAIFMISNRSTEKMQVDHVYGQLKTLWDRLAKRNEAGANIYIALNLFNGPERKTANVTKVNGLAIDYDGGDWPTNDIDTLLARFPVKPNLVVETSPGNIQAIWLIRDIPLTQFKPMQQALAKRFGSDPSVCDLPRVFRLAGTVNHKRAEPFLTRTLHVDDAEPMAFNLFAEAMGLDAGSKLPVTKVADSSEDIHPPSKIDKIQAALAILPSDDRDTWVSVGMALNAGLGESGLVIFKEWSATSPKYDEAELMRQWASFKPRGGITLLTLFWLARNYQRRHIDDLPRESLPKTSLDVARLFVNRVAGILLYSEQSDRWHAYDFGIWKETHKGAERIALEFVRSMKALSERSGDKAFSELAMKMQTLNAARDLLRIAETDPKLSIGNGAFDPNPNRIALKVKTPPEAVEYFASFDLIKYAIRPSREKDLAFRIAGATYDGEADCPSWIDFLSQVTQENEELQEFLRLAVGYTLFGHAKEQLMFLLLGPAGNGKGVFCRILYALLGDYAAAIPTALLKPNALSANGPSPALMRLQGTRVWIGSEANRRMPIDDAVLKQITGGDHISARNLYGATVEFLPVGKLWFSTNELPIIRYDDAGMWRRLVPIPFNANFLGKGRNNLIEDELMSELPGILNWALEGAADYAMHGKLEIPGVIRRFAKQLRQEVDSVGNWVDQCCKAGDDLSLQSKVAYDSYAAYMRAEKGTILSQKQFKAEMEKHGFRHGSSKHFNYFQGLALHE